MADDGGDVKRDAIVVARDYDVFISYAHVDADHDVTSANRIAAWLEDLGYHVWWDRKLIAGQKWAPELKTKIERSRRVIVLWSPQAAKAEWVGFETKLADIEDKLVPLVIEPHPTPEAWASTHRVVVTSFEDQKQAILDVLKLPPPASKANTGAHDDARVSIAELPTGAGKLIGREIELAALHAAWDSTAPGADVGQKSNVVVLHAIGGAGKTALMRRFVDDLADRGFPGADKVFGWSAYSQGSGDDRNVNADKFLSDALRHFGWDVDQEPIKDQLQKGRTLAGLVRGGRNLFILDGLEPLQAPPEVNGGYLRDRGVATLVKELAANNKGLLLITSRQQLPELASIQPPRVLDGALEALSTPAGAELLRELGVWGSQEELETASDELEGHALSLSLLGTYLDTVYAGDVRKRDHFDFAQAVAGAAKQGQRRARRAQHVMARYVERFAEIAAATGDGGAELAILALVGLFDRPAPKDALDELLREPAIAGLTDSFHGIDAREREERWTWAVRRLRALKLLNSEDERDPGALDAHPVVREHSAAELKAAAPAAYTEAHSRLYDFYRFLFLKGLDVPDALRTSEAYGLLALCAAYPENTNYIKQHASQGRVPPGVENVVSLGLVQGDQARTAAAANLIGTPDFDLALREFLPEDDMGMQPCFAAITHGCAADRHHDAFWEIYQPRVRRGNLSYSTRKLGLFGADLSALAHFFDKRFSTPAESLSDSTRALMLNLAGFRLRAVGRLSEALEPMFAATEAYNNLGNLAEAASNASSVSELLSTLGRLPEATRTAAESCAYADQSGEANWRIASPATYGDALHHTGDIAGAAEQFAEAERRQAVHDPNAPLLYSYRGYQYCDLLLTQHRAAEVLRRYDYFAAIRKHLGDLAGEALEELLAGRAHAMLAQMAPVSAEESQHHMVLATDFLNAAVTLLIRANNEDEIPRGFLARAGHRRWLYATTGDPAQLAGAEQDLADAEEVARRDEPNGGAMRLYLTDIALERCRLCVAQLPAAIVEEPAETSAPPPDGEPASAEADASTEQQGAVARGRQGEADDWEDGLVERQDATATQVANALEQIKPAQAIAAEPKPLRRWDMWTWLEQDKARAEAIAAEREAAAPPPEGDPQNATPNTEAEVSAQSAAIEAPILATEQRELIARAEAYWQDAARLIADTGYHRRDGERDELRRTLDRLATL